MEKNGFLAQKSSFFAAFPQTEKLRNAQNVPEFFRSDALPRGNAVFLVNVFLIATGGSQFFEFRRRAGVVESAVRFEDFDQRGFDVLRHALGVPADVEIRAFVVEPFPDFGAGFADFVLNVNLVILVAGPRAVEPREQPVRERLFPFRLIKEVRLDALVAEEEPVFALGAFRRAVLHEAAEGRDARSRTDHDDGSVQIRRRTEMRVGNEHGKRRFADLRVFAEERRAHAVALASVRFVADDGDRQVDAVFADEIRAGRNGIEARHQLAELFDKRLRVAFHGRELFAEVEHVARVDPRFLGGGIGVPEHFGELRLVVFALRVVVDELHEFLRDRAEGKFRRERVAQAQRLVRFRGRYRFVAAEFVGFQHRVHELRRLAREHAERVAGFIDETASREIDFEMNRFLLRFRRVRAGTHFQFRRKRVVLVISARRGV